MPLLLQYWRRSSCAAYGWSLLNATMSSAAILRLGDSTRTQPGSRPARPLLSSKALLGYDFSETTSKAPTNESDSRFDREVTNTDGFDLARRKETLHLGIRVVERDAIEKRSRSIWILVPIVAICPVSVCVDVGVCHVTLTNIFDLLRPVHEVLETCQVHAASIRDVARPSRCTRHQVFGRSLRITS